MNVLKSIIRELNQHFKLSNLFENRQYLKMLKYKKCTCEYTTTFQPVKIVHMSLSGAILVSSLPNE